MRRGLTLLVMVLLLAGCSSAPKRELPADELQDTRDGLQVETVWRASAGSGAHAPGDALGPVVVDGEVFVVDRRGRLSVFDLETGNRLWRMGIGSPVSAGPAVSDELIVVASREGKVIGVDRRNREVLWISGVTSEVLAMPLISSDTVIVQAADGRVFGLRTDTGSRRWIYDRSMPPLTLRGGADPRAVGSRILAGLPNGRIVALGRSDGRLLWEAQVGEPRGGSDLERMRDVARRFVIERGEIYAAAYQGEVVALGLQEGRSSWRRELSSTQGVAADGERVYVAESNGRLWALDRRTGAAIWRQDQTEGLQATAPMVLGDVVVFGDERGRLTWLDAQDGELLARTRHHRAGFSRHGAVANGDLIVLSDGGRLLRLSVSRP
ncbi:MAG: outer membrane protein assembly factor BamB [Ectothiorhodospiraceae bacterium]|nr:outer membrane protein assembly factor BamB [Ectothiorhodospiraceae bacterium]